MGPTQISIHIYFFYTIRQQVFPPNAFYNRTIGLVTREVQTGHGLEQSGAGQGLEQGGAGHGLEQGGVGHGLEQVGAGQVLE